MSSGSSYAKKHRSEYYETSAQNSIRSKVFF